jgi:RNA ligase (TIGR02306 family)
MSERKLASVRKIDEINPIEGADAIEVATVGGWKVVVKKGEFKAGDLAFYLEIDSFVPTFVAPFLTKPGHYPKTYNGFEGERLRTVRLRGQISQGLLLPCKGWVNEDGTQHEFAEDEDVTNVLGIQKWEAPLSAQLAGVAKGNFPSFIPKTDQERIQNLKREIHHWNEINAGFEVTEKLDGSSMTVYLYEGEFGVCSRNLNLKESEDNTFWKVARELNLEAKLRIMGGNLSLQGELIGPGIQKNPYGLDKHEFYLFDIYDINTGEYTAPFSRHIDAKQLEIKHVPIITVSTNLGGTDMDAFLKYAEGKSALNSKTEREGLVYKCIQSPGESFKVISNKFLLKGGE